MSIDVNVRLFGVNNRNPLRISLEEGSRNLRSLLETLARHKATSYIKDGCVVSINNKLVIDDLNLKDKDEITIMPMLHGG